MTIVRLFAVALVGAVVGPTAAWCGCRGASTRQTADFAARGAHGVGVHTLQLVDATRPTAPNGTFVGAASRTLDVEVWYPSAKSSATAAILDAPLDARWNAYPLILYGHALKDNREGEAYLAEHLASAAMSWPRSTFSSPSSVPGRLHPRGRSEPTG